MSPEAGLLLQNQIAPRLGSAIPHAVAFIGCEDAEEVVQDSIAMAAKIIHNAEHRGKTITRSATGRRNEISAGNVAYYTIVKLRSGRRSTGFSVSDVYGIGTQINGRTRVTSLDEAAANDASTGDEIFELHDVLASDQEDPGTKAARKMDWDAFWAGLSDRERAVIEFMLEGKSLASLSRSRGFNASTLAYSKNRLAKAIAEFMGSDILIEVRRQPQWKESLNASRERFACREERRHH